MKFMLQAHFENTGGIFTLVFFAIHWGNRVIGITVFNVVIEILY